MDSCIYEGQVRHSRTEPVLHRFRYRIFMMYLDLDELPALFERRWFWSAEKRALARFRRRDHVGPASQPLSESVADLVEAKTGQRPEGPIRLLTNLSYFGYCFNPVSFFYCFDAAGERVETIVAEVSNTPWGERDTYVLADSDNVGRGRIMRYRPKKKMHVSPFMPMELEYDWCFGTPGDRLSVYMANKREGKRFFDAAIALERSEITGRSLARVLVTYPFMTAKVIASIYWQAMKLWLKRSPFYQHPEKRQKIAASSQ